MFRGLLYLTVSLLVLGMIFMHQVEHWSLLESLYWSVITLTTVGYGDLAPETALGQVFSVLIITVVGSLSHVPSLTTSSTRYSPGMSIGKNGAGAAVSERAAVLPAGCSTSDHA